MATGQRDSFLLQAIANSRLDAELSIGHPDPDSKAGIAPEGIIKIPYSARSAHMHVLGRTRSGKSRFIADLIRQDIMNGCGLCLIDPHGELYDLTINWLAQEPFVQKLQKNIHPVCFTDLGTTFRYNPLHIDSELEAYSVASNVTNAITRVYGGKDATDTPLVWFVLDVACTILALRGLPLAAAKHFLMNSSFDRELRNKISDGVPSEYYRALGLEMSRMTPKEFRETVASTGRRLHQFFKNPLVERIFSTTENTADLRRLMDDRHVLLLNTSDQGGLVDFDQLRTIGMLFVNNLFQTARKRDPKTKPTPFFLYIDEAQNYLSNDIENILSQAAKRGLYLTLSHQFLGQLTEADELIYNGVMSGTLMKAVFGITMEEADVFVDELFADRIDFERVKEKLASPHVVGQEIIRLRGKSKTDTTARAHGKAYGTAHSSAHGVSETESYSSGTSVTEASTTGMGSGSSQSESAYVPADPALQALGITQGASLGESATSSTANSETYSSAYSKATGSSSVYANTTSASQSDTTSTGKALGESESEALKPIIKWFSTQTYTLEEQRYELKRMLAYQQERHGFLAVRRKGTIGFTTLNVPDPLHIPQSEATLLESLVSKSPWIVPATEVPNILSHPVVRALLGAPGKATPEPDDYFEPG